MATYRCWFKDDGTMLVTAENEIQAKQLAEQRSKEQYADAYFDNERERRKVSTVAKVEKL